MFSNIQSVVRVRGCLAPTEISYEPEIAECALKRLRFIRVKRLREYHCHSPDRRYLKYHEYITCSAQAKIMIAKKMGMTIGGTNQAAMVLILRSFMIRLQRRRAYMDEG
jgi:hypothetical protein